MRAHTPPIWAGWVGQGRAPTDFIEIVDTETAVKSHWPEHGAAVTPEALSAVMKTFVLMDSTQQRINIKIVVVCCKYKTSE